MLAELQGKTLLVMTPAQSFTVSYVKSLAETIKWCSTAGVDFRFLSHDGSHITQLRSSMTEAILSSNEKFDFVLWIDSDISWTVSNLIDILESPHDITSGVYMISEDGGISVHKTPGSVNRHIDMLMKYSDLNQHRRYFEISACGFGFLCIKNKALSAMRAEWFSPRIATNIYKNGKEEEIYISGEDIAWCYSSRDAGFQVMCDSTVLVGHEKRSVWRVPR